MTTLWKLIAPSLIAASAYAGDSPITFLEQPPAPEPLVSKPSAHEFGKDDGTWWCTIGGGVASTFGDDTDYNVRISFTTFLAPNFQIGGELGLWAFTQKGTDDPFGINPVLVLRYHFYNDGDWTIFGEAGIGLLFATDDIPTGGSSIDFTPRVGIGATKKLTDDGTRLEFGVRWHHISNARIFGDDENPGRDLPMAFIGVTFPF